MIEQNLVISSVVHDIFRNDVFYYRKIINIDMSVQGSRVKLEYYPDSGQCTIDIKNLYSLLWHTVGI